LPAIKELAECRRAFSDTLTRSIDFCSPCQEHQPAAAIMGAMGGTLMNTGRWAAVACTFAAIGCANPVQSTGQTAANLAQAFVGKPLQAFTMRYGFPYASMQSADGSAQHQWRSDLLLHQAPTRTTVTSFTTGNTTSMYANTTGGSQTAMYCVVQIQTDQSEHISAISIVRDTLGGFAISRCAEVLGL